MQASLSLHTAASDGVASRIVWTMLPLPYHSGSQDSVCPYNSCDYDNDNDEEEEGYSAYRGVTLADYSRVTLADYIRVEIDHMKGAALR